MMFIGQLPFGKLAKLAGILMLALVLFLALLKFTPAAITQYLPDRFVTWQGRLERFFDGHKDNLDESGTYKITDDNYQVTHAKIAIARGGVFGQMPGHGQQRDFLPQAYSDFIYAIIIEELGIVGGIFVLLLYIMLLVRVGMIARKCDKSFPKFLVLGCGSPSFGEYGGSCEFSARYRATDAVGEPGWYVYAYFLYLFRDHIERKSFWSQYRK